VSGEKRDSSVAFEAGPAGLKIAADGGGAGRLSEALADLLSPFSNSMGLLGDQLGYARRAAAFRAARKAVAMLERDGIAAGNVPPKILLPWLEGASLEVDQTLEDAWAGLLARAVKSADAVIVSYMDVLKRIGAKEAKLLDTFASDTLPSFTQAFYDPRFTGGLNSPGVIVEVVLDGLDRINTPGEIAEHMEGFGTQSNCQVLYYKVDDAPIITTRYFDENEHAVSNMEHLGLIRFGHSLFKDRRGRKFSIYWFEITKFAFDMLWACSGVLTGPARS
jgi:Abortive infection alpha